VASGAQDENPEIRGGAFVAGSQGNYCLAKTMGERGIRRGKFAIKE